MKKITDKKFVFAIAAIAILCIAVYFAIALYNATKAEEQLTAATITTPDIAPYLTGIVEIVCNNSSGGDAGSGSLWDIPNLGLTVLTNQHVIDDADNSSRNLGTPGGFDENGRTITIMNACDVSLDGSDNTTAYYIDLANKHQWNGQADATDLPIRFNTGEASTTSSTPPVADLNYSISRLPLCPDTVPVGTPMAMIGFPSYADATTTTEDGTSTQDYEITTTGIVSGFAWNDLLTGAALQYPDYFTSALADGGNSGGIALAKNSDGLCVLGIPSVIGSGEYNVSGVIQNIQNVFQLD